MDCNVEIVALKERLGYEVELELKGICLREELMAIISICKEEKKCKEDCFPMFISFDDSRQFVGEFELNFSNVLILSLMSKDYELLLIDNVNDQSAEILGGDTSKICESLSKLIRL